MTNRFYYAYARHALVTALRLARVQAGDVVLLPSLICRDVLASLAAVNAVPIFYEIGEDLQISRDALLPRARVVIAVNYFGFPALLDRISERLSDSRTIIIEDNAHGWLSADEKGAPLGFRTPLGVTSFRKTILTPDGAFLHWSGDGSLDLSALHEPLTPRQERLKLSFRLRRNTSRLEKITRLPLRSGSRFLVRSMRTINGKPAIETNSGEEFELPRFQAIHEKSLELFARVDSTAEIRRRREVYMKCEELAISADLTPVFSHLTPGVCPQGFAFFSQSERESNFRRQIVRQRLGEIISWPAISIRCSLPLNSPLRSLKLVNFLQ